MLFDRPASLPIATMRSSSHVDRLLSQARAARRWARPRLVPAAVALVGMLAVLGSAEYLTHLARYTPEQSVAQPAPPPHLEVTPKAITFTDHTGVTMLARIVQLPASPLELAPVPVPQQ